MALKEAMSRANTDQCAAFAQHRRGLDHGEASRLEEQHFDEVSLRLDNVRAAVTRAARGNSSAMLKPKESPADWARGGNPQIRHCRPTTYSAVNYSYNAVLKCPCNR